MKPNGRKILERCTKGLNYGKLAERSRDALLETFRVKSSATEVQEEALSEQPSETIPEPTIDEVLPSEENATPDDSRYARFAIWLQQ